MSKIRWGIIGTGRIAEDFYGALKQVEDAEVVAVGGSSLERAQKFALRHQIPKSYGSYEELVLDKDVELVYVATLHPFHKEATIIALNNKKPVLCEKPLAINSKDAEEMIECARKNDTLFMEAMWTRYFPLMFKVREMLSQGVIGEVKGVQGSFGFVANPNIDRLVKKEYGAGSLLDIGVYTCSLSSMVLGPEYPKRIEAVGKINENGIDEQVGIVLEYQKGIASLYVSFVSNLENSVTVLGTKGRLTWAPIQCPVSFKVVKDTGVEEYPFNLPESEHKFNFLNSIGLQYEAKYFQKLWKDGKKESDVMTLEESLNVMKILDEVRDKIGLKY